MPGWDECDRCGSPNRGKVAPCSCVPFEVFDVLNDPDLEEPREIWEIPYRSIFDPRELAAERYGKLVNEEDFETFESDSMEVVVRDPDGKTSTWTIVREFEPRFSATEGGSE